MDDREPQFVDAKAPPIDELSDEHADCLLRNLFGSAFEEIQSCDGFVLRLRTALKIALADPCTRLSGQDIPEFLLLRGHIWDQLGRRDLAYADFSAFHQNG